MEDDHRHDRQGAVGSNGKTDARELTRRLFQRYHRSVHAFFAKRRFGEDDARELTQQVFLRVFQNIDTLQQEGSADAWLRTVVVNTWKNEIRRRRTQKRDALEVSLEAEREAGKEAVDQAAPLGGACPPDALERALAAEELRAVQACVGELSTKMRCCLELHFFQERQYREIAELLHVTPETVKSHIREALRRVRLCLARRAPMEGG